MKTIAMILTLTLASSAFAGGNEGIWISNVNMKMITDADGFNEALANQIDQKLSFSGSGNASTIINGPIIIDPGTGGPVPVVGPGGTDGQVVNGGIAGTLNTVNIIEQPSLSGSSLQVLAIPGGDSGGSSGVTSSISLPISSLKLVWQTNMAALVKVNHTEDMMSLTNETLDNSASLTKAVEASAQTRDWVQVQ